jgi:hypothetical protein
MGTLDRPALAQARHLSPFLRTGGPIASKPTPPESTAHKGRTEMRKRILIAVTTAVALVSLSAAATTQAQIHPGDDGKAATASWSWGETNRALDRKTSFSIDRLVPSLPGCSICKSVLR